jgi:hypothetical protein
MKSRFISLSKWGKEDAIEFVVTTGIEDLGAPTPCAAAS